MSNSMIKNMVYFATVITLTLFVSVTAFSVEEGATTAVQESTTQAAEETTSPEESATKEPDKPVVSGFVTVDGELYYFLPETGEKLVPAVGIYKIDGKAYLFSEGGKIVRYNHLEAVTEFNGGKYCITEDNSLASSLQKINGATYYSDEATYKIKTGWISFKEGKRYFGTDGKMYSGLKSVSGKYYYFDSDGIMQTGFITFKAGKRYFGADGKMCTGLKSVSGKYYYFDSNGIMKTGFVTFKAGKRYFGADGKMYTGLKSVSGKYYYFDSNGIMKTGWIEFSAGKRRFHLRTGVMLTGKKKISGKYYYFNSKGIMKKGWITIDNNKYYFSKKTAAMLTGWNKISGKYYYFYSNGKMAKNAIVGNYYVLSNGTRATSNAAKYAVKAVKSATNSKMTKEQKLKACYNWIIKNFYYARDYQDPAKLKNNWTKSYAEYAFKNKKGNCYKYASAMGYCAEILGYEAKVAYGKIASGSSMTNHGWTEIVINGKTYIFDTVQADHYKGNYYKRTYSNYPKKLQKSGSKSIVIS